MLSAVCPKPWEKTFVSFENTYFMKAKVRTFNHIPINFGVDQGGPYCHRQGRCRAQAHLTAGDVSFQRV